jgi:peptide/nickel transport system ATP-binding protein
MVFQDPMTSLDPVQRISRQLTEPMRAHIGLSKEQARTRAIDLLEQVGVPDPVRRMRAYPNELSGGLRQRVAIAIALSCDPDVLIADEPTSALDVTVQAQILDVLDRLRVERRLAVLLITHDLGIVATRADDVAVMYGGRIIEHGSTRDVFATPHHRYTRALLDAVPRVDHAGHVRLAAIGGAPPILLGDLPGCSFAPRCRARQERCLLERPPLEPLAGESQQVACWYPLNVPVRAPVRAEP